MPVNLTEGSVFKNIAVFSTPYFAAYFLQTLYGLADLFIVGQFEGADAITAVAVGSQVMHFLTVMIVGLAMGTTVLTSRAVGAGNLRSVSRITGNTIVLFSLVAVISTVALLLLCGPIVSLLKTPAEAVDGTVRYLQICFAGIPFIVAYNLIAAIFRGMGDSKHPMYFIAVACVLNIILDYVFMGGMHLGAAGAALATVLAQSMSVLISLFATKKLHWGVKLCRRDFRPHKALFKGLLNIGAPIAAQDGFIQVSFLFITMIANSRGVEIAAAVGIVEKIITFLFLVPSTMLSTISAIAAQNIGAGKHAQAKKTLWTGTAIAAGIGLFFALLFQPFSEPFLALFTSDASVVKFGTEYLRTYVIDCLVAGIHFCFSGYFCACGLSILSFVHNALSIVLFRIPGTWLAAEHFPETLTPMGLAAPAGSLFSVLFCVLAYRILLHKNLVRT
ncbi:MAG: MATE family efflux transporter [Fibrobacter sp.]|nr:MATE family efflux transporter [Fibrobacter sp.]